MGTSESGAPDAGATSPDVVSGVGGVVTAARAFGVRALADAVEEDRDEITTPVAAAVEALSAAGAAAAGLRTGAALDSVTRILSERLDEVGDELSRSAEGMRDSVRTLVDVDGEVTAGVRAAG